MEDHEGVGERLRYLIHKTGMKNKEFARTVGIAPTFLSCIITGRYKLPRQRAEDICEVFDINIDWLLFGKGKMSVWDFYNKEGVFITVGGPYTMHKLTKNDKKRLCSLPYKNLPRNMKREIQKGLGSYTILLYLASTNKPFFEFFSEKTKTNCRLEHRFAGDYLFNYELPSFYDSLNEDNREELLKFLSRLHSVLYELNFTSFPP